MKRKQGRVAERSRTVREKKKGEEENSFQGKRLCFLTCLLMGDPQDYVDSAEPPSPARKAAGRRSGSSRMLADFM